MNFYSNFFLTLSIILLSVLIFMGGLLPIYEFEKTQNEALKVAASFSFSEYAKNTFLTFSQALLTKPSTHSGSTMSGSTFSGQTL